MSGSMTDYLENKLIDWLLRGQTFTPPATFYAALFTSNPGEAGGGTEVSGGNYSRAAITSSLANWAGTQAAGTAIASSGSSATTSNNNAITFPVPSAGWGTVTGIGLMDASSAGNMLFYSTLTTPRAVNNGDGAPSFPATQVSIQIDG